MTRLQLSFPRLGIPTRISPNPEEGKRKGGVQRRNPVFGWPTERSSFVTLNYILCKKSRIKNRASANQAQLRHCTTAKAKYGAPARSSHRKGATACNTEVTVQEATALATPGRSRHHMPSRRVTPRRGIPQIGLPPRRGCEASRRCKWVKPDPSLLMSDALFPLASIPGLEEAPGQTPHASRLKHQPPLPEVFARSPGGLTPTRIWGPSVFSFLKCDPRGLVVSSRGLHLCGTPRSSSP